MDVNNSEITSYDDVPYPSNPYWRTHPCHLASIAVLFGMNPAPPRKCRVLELGSASGGNLIPMAQDLPDSQFVGIDASIRQIDEGRGSIGKLGLTNIRLDKGDILEFDFAGETFDYIVCHGVFSWVPRPVQDRILELGRKLLTPHGVMYVSYNTYPGWHLRAVVRDMMQYHARNFKNPKERIGQARALLKFLVQSATGTRESYRQLLRDEAEILAKCSDAYLFHEHLEEVNEASYFYDFMQRSESIGLQYLGESFFSTMITSNLGAEIAELLKGATMLQQEQYMDFLRNRTFRETLLCHREVSLRRDVAVDRLCGQHVCLKQRLDLSECDPASPDEGNIQLGGGKITVRSALTKLAFEVLNNAWPRYTAFETLCQTARQELASRGLPSIDTSPMAERARLAGDLMLLYSRELIDAKVDPPSYDSQPGDYPVAPAWPRLQAEQGSTVTTLRHGQVALPAPSREIIRHLDGQHSRSDLCDVLDDAIRGGRLQVKSDDQPIESVTRTMLEAIVETSLRTMAEGALIASSTK